MRKNAPLSIRLISAFLIPIYTFINIIPGSVCAGENSIAVLEYGTGTGSLASDLWRETVAMIGNDPFLLVKDDDVITGALESWKQEVSDRKEATRALFLAYRGKVNGLVDSAWGHYFSFRFDDVLRSVRDADRFLDMVSDTALQSELLFELLLLEAMAVRAIENDTSSKPFTRAARLKSDARLPEEKYSPQIIRAFEKAVKKELSGARSTVSINGRPSGAKVLIDGKMAGVSPLSGYEVTPGSHFLEFGFEGYETHRTRISAKDWEALTVNYTLEPSGPSGNTAEYFLGRIKDGDTASLNELLLRTGVGHILFTAEEDAVLMTWLIGPGGRILDSRITPTGPATEPSPADLYSMLLPLRVQREEITDLKSLYLNVPPLQIGLAEAEKRDSPVKWYTLLGGIILISLAAGAAQGERTSQVEVAW